MTDGYGIAVLDRWVEKTWDDWRRQELIRLYYAVVRCLKTGKRFLDGWHWNPQAKMVHCPRCHDWHWLEHRTV